RARAGRKSSKISKNLPKSSKNPKFSRFARTLRARAGRKSSKISKNLPKIQNVQGLHEPFWHVRVENLPKSRKIFHQLQKCFQNPKNIPPTPKQLPKVEKSSNSKSAPKT